MDMPDRHLTGVRSMIIKALEATGVDRVRTVGHLDTRVDAVLGAYCRSNGSRLEKVDCILPKHARSIGNETCAWILPEMPSYHAAYCQFSAIRAICVTQGTPMLVLVPHLAGAQARRDHYFEHADVPDAWRHPAEACEMRGVTAERAIVRGGLRNGALTAIEDFADEQWDEGAALAWTRLPAIGGFCALFDVDAHWAAQLACCLARFHTGSIIAAMSEQELRDYLPTVDRPGGRAGGAIQ